MKNVILVAMMLITVITQAQTNFEKGMTKAFELWQEGKADEAENMFERIANAEPKEWLPNYYIAFMNSLKSWNEKDGTIIKAQLDKAQQHLDAAMIKSENNPELLVMQAQVYTNWIAFDGMTYGMKYSGKVTELYTKAYELAPENPRVAFSKVEWEMGSARYFGQDTKPFCEKLEATLPLFDSYERESDFHPNWGKERAEQSVKACKE